LKPIKIRVTDVRAQKCQNKEALIVSDFIFKGIGGNAALDGKS